MKRLMIIVLSIFILSTTLCSCGNKVNTKTVSLPPSQKTLNINPSNEPPLWEYVKNLTVPNFLNEEQQNLYRRAYTLFPVFHGSTIQIDDFPLLEGQQKTEIKYTTYKDMEYIISQGRYQNWNDFESLMLNIFTENYYHELIGLNRKTPSFIEIDSKLCYIDAAMGSRLEYVQPDTFALISKTDKEIKFNVIGHYAEPRKGEKDVEYIERRDKGEYDSTEKFPITMVKTTDGWRFSNFNVAF